MLSHPIYERPVTKTMEDQELHFTTITTRIMIEMDLGDSHGGLAGTGSEDAFERVD